MGQDNNVQDRETHEVMIYEVGNGIGRHIVAHTHWSIQALQGMRVIRLDTNEATVII